jgi:biopolymer transport protein ExbB
MRFVSILSATLVLAGAGSALAVDAEALDRAKARSEQELEASLKELSGLRDSIAAEKIPLARQLADLEQRLTELRRQNDDALRSIDSGTLDQTKAQGELKLRQDEIGYIGNLLDEYARNLETRLGVGETERYGPVIATAKDAATNKDLTQAQRFDRQFAVVDLSIARLDDVIGGTRFPGSAIDPKGMLAEGTFALVGPIAVFASKDGTAAGLALPQSGTNRPAVRPLEASVGGAIATLVATGKGLLPVDPTRGGALKELIQKWSLIDIYKKGGPIMHPLLFVSILALAVVIERVIFLFSEQRKRDNRALQQIFAAVERGDFAGATATGSKSKYFVVRALAYALEHREHSLGNALVVANAEVMKRFRRGIGILDTAITIAPLLGLLGTVTGMMHSFSLIGGELSAPGAITGGIAEALIATAFGLMIAILCLVPYNYLNNRIDQVRQEMEAASAQLELLVNPQRGIVSALGAAHTAAQGAA